MQDEATVTALSAPSPCKPYRVKQIADLLDVHVSTVYRAIESGALRALRLGQGRGGLRVPHAAFEDYLAAHTTAAPMTGEVA
jgi:excisionase family DNA binding protein